jgi:hypothetical protein
VGVPAHAQSYGTVIAGGALAKSGIESEQLAGSGPEALGSVEVVVLPFSATRCSSPRFVLCSDAIRLEFGGTIASVGPAGQHHVDTMRMTRLEIKGVHRGVDDLGGVAYFTLGAGLYRYAFDLSVPKVAHGGGVTVGGGLEVPAGPWLPYGELQIRIMNGPFPAHGRKQVVTGASVMVGLRKVMRDE